MHPVGHVKASKRRDTGALNLEDVVGTLQHVRNTVEVEGEVRKVRDSTAIDLVLAVPALLGTDLGVDHLRHVGREGNQRGT